MSNAWLSSFSTTPPPPVVLGEDTIRGGLVLVLAQDALLLDRSRDQTFRGLVLPAGWSNVSTGLGAVRATREGVVLDTGPLAGATAGLETPDDYDRFDVVVDFELVFPVGATTGPVDLAVLEARTASGDSVRVRLRRGFGADPTRTVAFGDFTIAGVTTTGGLALAPAVGPRGKLTLRIVRNQECIFGFVGVRSVDPTDGPGAYASLVKVLEYNRFTMDAGRVRFTAGNAAVPTRVRSVVSNFTVRSHCTISGRLLDDKLDIGARRIVGKVPAATVEEVGLVDLIIFGLFGELVFTDGFRYVLPLEKTLGRSSARGLITVQDPVLRDGSN